MKEHPKYRMIGFCILAGNRSTLNIGRDRSSMHPYTFFIAGLNFIAYIWRLARIDVDTPHTSSLASNAKL
jgi:hypothetical protein